MNIDIYENGELDFKRTMKAKVNYYAKKIGPKIDYFFVNGHWPKELIQ